MKKFVRSKLFLAVVFVSIAILSAALTGASVVHASRSNQGSKVGVTSVSIKSGKIEPSTITLHVGQQVQINNNDTKNHELSLGAGTAEPSPEGQAHDHHGSFSSGEFSPSEAWKVSFGKPGSYFLHDHEDPDSNILVVVY